VNGTVQQNVNSFNATLGAYGRLSSLAFAQAVAKKGGDFGKALARRLRPLAPVKGSIRAERLAAVKAGGGIKIRAAILSNLLAMKGLSQSIADRGFRFGKKMKGTVSRGGNRLNFWALAAQKEINLRESGRGFVAYSSSYKSLAASLDGIPSGYQRTLRDRANRYLSAVSFTNTVPETSLVFKWGGNPSSGDVAEALHKPKAQAAIVEALAEVESDMMVYIRRKQRENGAILGN